MVVMTADKGMCGSFNANIIRAASNHIVAHPDQAVTLGVIGRRGRDFFRRRDYPTRFELVNFTRKPDYEHAQAITREAIAAFTAREADSVCLAYNEFKSVLQQRIVIAPLLPIPKGAVRPGRRRRPRSTTSTSRRRRRSSTSCCRASWSSRSSRALLESAAAQNAAQMVAMDNATKNSGEVIDTLTLTMNKVRQAAITREIIEVVSGAGAL